MSLVQRAGRLGVTSLLVAVGLLVIGLTLALASERRAQGTADQPATDPSSGNPVMPGAPPVLTDPSVSCTGSNLGLMQPGRDGMALTCTVIGAGDEDTNFIISVTLGGPTGETTTVDPVCTGELRDGAGHCTGNIMAASSAWGGSVNARATLLPNGRMLNPVAVSTAGQNGETTPPAAVQTGTGSGASGIEGQVTIGPTRPGPVRLSDPPSERPYQATITVLDQAGQSVTRFDTDANGRFQVALPPGTYTVQPESPGRLPFAGPPVVTVNAGQFSPVQIRYESGMR